MTSARLLRDEGFGDLVTYSPKVFIPLTKLCRDVCHYCTFAHPPRRGERAFMTVEEILDIAREGAKAGCTEALFTLGDKPELRYRMVREELAALGHETTIAYLAEMAGLVLNETGLLPHLNPGVMTAEDIALLRPVSASMGLMLEGVSPVLMKRGGPHYGSPDKDPVARLETIRLAGAIYHRDFDWHRGDAGRAPRCARKYRGTTSALWPHPGNHYSELSRQDRHSYGRRAGTRS